MSRVTDLARQEAERVEAENPEPEPEPEPTPEPEPGPSPVPPVAGADPEKLAKAIERAHTRYENDLRKIDGLHFDSYQECPTCNSVGYVLDLPDATDEFLQDPGRKRCPDCDGFGGTKTGARPEAQGIADCSGCGGLGWVIKPRDPVAAPVYQLPTMPMTPTQPNGEPYAAPDAWGRPSGHPHYGMNPAMVGA